MKSVDVRRACAVVLSLGVAIAGLAWFAGAARPPQAREDEPQESRGAVVVDPSADHETLEELFRESGGRGPITVRWMQVVPPPHGLRRRLEPRQAYLPVDTRQSNPALDGFPASFHAEPSIAAQGDQVVVVYNDGGADAGAPYPDTTHGSTDGFAISTDGGNSFTDEGKRPGLGGSFGSYNGDNVVAAGPDGDFYYLSDSCGFTAMAVSRSTDGGATWTNPVDAANGLGNPPAYPFFDKGWIAVDRSGGPTRGNVYVTWSSFNAESTDGTALYVSVSRDHGATWTPHLLDTFPTLVAVTYVQVAPNGVVYVGEQSDGTALGGHSTGTNYLIGSSDGGSTWWPRATVGSYVSALDEQAEALVTPPSGGMFSGVAHYLNGPIEADSSLRIAVDPSDPSGKTVFVTNHAKPDGRPGDESDILLWRTTNGGRTFEGPVRVNDDDTLTDQFMPDLWVAADGTLGVMWLDRRNDPSSNWKLEAWMALSHDHGATFTPSFPVSSSPFSPVGRMQMSDYNGVFADAERFLLSWGDSRATDLERQQTFVIYGAALPLAGPGALLSLAGIDGPGSGAPAGSFTVRLRNDGLQPSGNLTLKMVAENATGPGSAQEAELGTIGGAHQTASATFTFPANVTGSFLRARLEVRGAAGRRTFPLAVALPGAVGPSTLLATDFEAGIPADWTVDPGAGGEWHASDHCLALYLGHSASHVAYFGRDATCTYGDYLSGGTPPTIYGSMTSRPIPLPPGASELRFKEAVGIPYRWTRQVPGRTFAATPTVQVSTDGGATFERIWGYGSMSRHLLPPSVPLRDSGNDTFGNPTWHDVALDLSPYGGHDLIVRFFFYGYAWNQPGWAVDDIKVISGP